MAHADLFADRYRLDQLVSEGRFTTVWRAYDTVLDRDVTVTLYRVAAGNTRVIDPNARAELWRELRLLARPSENPRLVTVFDAGQHRGQPFLVTRLMPAGNLVTLLEGQPGRRLAPQRAVAIACDVLEGLAALHGAGLVHREVRPAHIWMEVDGRAVLGGFGLVTAMGTPPLTGLVEDGRAAAYMAPELIRGDPAGPATDLYALGCTLYEMLTGRPPFAGNPLTVASQHLSATPPPASRLAPAVPEALDQALACLLGKEPAARPPTAQAAIALLRAAVEGVPAPPPRPEPVAMFRPSPQAFPQGEAVATRAPDGGRPATAIAAPPSPAPAPARPGGPRWAQLVAGAALVAALILAFALFLPGKQPLEEQLQRAQPPRGALDRVTPALLPTVSDLHVYDNVFDQREHEFVVDRTVTACFRLVPQGDLPLVVVVTRAPAPEPARVEGVEVARSEPVPQQPGPVCVPVPFNPGEPQPGEHDAAVMVQGQVLARARFRVLGTLTLPVTPAAPAGPMPTPTLDRARPPLTSLPEPPVRPVEMVTQYYRLLQQHRWQEAYDLLSRGYQQRQTYNRWFQSLPGKQELTLDAVVDGAGAGEVIARFRTADDAGGRALLRAWVEEWQIVIEQGEWRIVPARRQEVPLAAPTPGP